MTPWRVREGVDAFETLWTRVDDPRRQMQLAVLYLVVARDLDGIVTDRDRLVERMAHRHGWSPERTRDRLSGLVELGLLVREQGLAGIEILRLPR